MHLSLFKLSMYSLALLTVAACGGGGGTTTTTAVSGPPAAQIMADAGAVVGTPFQFFGQGADSNCETLEYSWDFTSDGTEDSALQSPMFSYTAVGANTVTLTVTDASGGTATATAVIQVGPAVPAATPPTVRLRNHTLIAEQDLQTLLIAEATDDAGGMISSFDWDFDGDGTFDLNDPVTPMLDQKSTQAFTYTAVGQVTPRVRANSDAGTSSIATMTIYICPTDSMPDVGPGVQIERNSVDTFPLAGATSDFLAAGANLTGGATTYSWDLDQDGVFTDGAGRELTTPPWPAAGPLGVTVRSTAGTFVAEARYSESVFDGGNPDNSPFAQALACTVLGSLNTPIQFLGLGVDFETAVTYSWDLDGDGAEDSTLQNPTFTYPEVGIYKPALTVTDGTGNTAEAYLTLVIECCTASDGTPPTPTKYWWCDCVDTYIFHGGNADIRVFCPTIIGATTGPTMAGVVACGGQLGAGGDPFCLQTLISQPPLAGSGPPFFPPPALFPVPPAPWTFNFASIGVDTPLRVVQYTTTLKLREPGCRVQILKCQVYVLHGFIGGGGGGDDLGGGDFRIDLMLDVQQPVGIQFPIPPIYDVEILLADQNPQWNFIDTLVAVLPPGWMQQQITDAMMNVVGVRFFTTTDPLVPGMPLNFQNIFGQTNNNTQPNNIRVRLSRLNGTIVGQEQLPVVTVP